MIARASDLAEGGAGVRFEVDIQGEMKPAFAIRHRGVVHAYLNVCAHQGVELDWLPGAFFSADGEHLICALHGALYDPATGACAGGPCAGAALARLAVRERRLPDEVVLVGSEGGSADDEPSA